MARSQERKAELIAQLANARTRLDRSGVHLGHALDVRTRARRSFKDHWLVWTGGAAALGLAVTRLRKSAPAKVEINTGTRIKGEDVAKTGAALAAGKMVFDILRPILLRMVMNQVGPWLEKRFAGPAPAPAPGTASGTTTRR